MVLLYLIGDGVPVWLLRYLDVKETIHAIYWSYMFFNDKDVVAWIKNADRSDFYEAKARIDKVWNQLPKSTQWWLSQ